MLLRGGHDVERRATIGKIWRQFFDGGDLSAGFRGVGGFGGGATDFFLLGNGGEGGNSAKQNGEGATDRDSWARSHE